MKHRLCFLVGLTLAGPLAAHEFWLWPDTFTPSPAATVSLGLRVGENFTGEIRPFNAARVSALRHFSITGVQDLISHIPPAPGVESLSVHLSPPGTHLFAYDSEPSTITLEADKFLAYLTEDGLQHVAALRHAAGQDHLPGRERYQRFVKTLVLVGPSSDATFAVHTGQRLEIVPTTDPHAAHAGQRLSFVVLFEGQPLAGATVRAWHHAGAKLIELHVTADSSGTASFPLASSGPWMISVVHMVPLQNVPDLDWESSWSSLTFNLQP